MTSWAISPEVIKVDSKEAQSNIAGNESQNLMVRTACGSGRLISNYEGLAMSEINRPLPQAVLTKPKPDPEVCRKFRAASYKPIH